MTAGAADTAGFAAQAGDSNQLDGLDSTAFVQDDEIYRISVETEVKLLAGLKRAQTMRSASIG